MSFLLGCENMGVEFPTAKVFDSVTLGINDGDRIGIVGHNGGGKSTLLSLLAGDFEPDEGSVNRTGNTLIGYLSQSDHLDVEDTVGHAVVGDVPEYVWASDARTREICAALIGDLDWNAKVGTLSGGQRRRCDLARVLIGDWDVLMLDEPTNHLDIAAISWLAQHLKRRWRAGEHALLVVTHDRWFLDEVCLTMWEVHDRVVEPFEGGYSAYIMQRVEREQAAQIAEQKRQNAIRRELAFLSRGARARSSKPKFHVEAARALIANDPPARDPIELKRSAISRLGKQCVDLVHVSAKYGDKTVIDDVEWIIGPGDRVGVLGENGAGKTTLLNLIQGSMKPSRGYVKIGQTVKFACISQQLTELEEVGDDRVRVLLSRYKQRYEIDGKEITPAQLLERLGFDSHKLNCPVKDLSGGQKRRLQLMLILLDKPNVLILDEPGNDLDTDMLAQMESLLDTWPGTLVLVTHDRYLMERVTDDQFALIDGKVKHCPRGVDEYLERLADARKARAAAEKDGSDSRDASGTSSKANGVSRTGSHANSISEVGSLAAGFPDSSSDDKPAVQPALSQSEIRELKKRLASTERKMQTMQGKVEDAENAMYEIDPSDYVALTEGQERIAALKVQLEELEEIWIETSDKLGL